MDILQLALVGLIILLGIFLAITGFQVFLILKDLKRALDKLNKVINSGQKIVEDVEKPMAAVAAVAQTVETGAKAIETGVQTVRNIVKEATPKPKQPSKPRFYKKIMK